MPFRIAKPPESQDWNEARGFLHTVWSAQFGPPQFTTAERDALTAKAGLFVYNTTTNKLNFYNGTAWEVVTSV